jgi:hypothetical protein
MVENVENFGGTQAKDLQMSYRVVVSRFALVILQVFSQRLWLLFSRSAMARRKLSCGLPKVFAIRWFQCLIAWGLCQRSGQQWLLPGGPFLL